LSPSAIVALVACRRAGVVVIVIVVIVVIVIAVSRRAVAIVIECLCLNTLNSCGWEYGSTLTPLPPQRFPQIWESLLKS
jgi:hypothetical protein